MMMRSGLIGALARLIVVIAIASFVAVGPSVGFGPADLAAQFGSCTVRYNECGTEGHDCPSCSALCEQDCHGYEWDGEDPDPNCFASGIGNCDPWCGIDEACYLKECGCTPPETK